MMEFALLRCCATPVFLKQYESSTDAVLKKLGVGVVEVKEFNCCGYPLKNYNFKAFVLSSARNLALAEKRGLHIMTFCNCCYGSLKHADHLMKEDPSLRKEIQGVLAKEGLGFEGSVEVRHLFQILYHDLGIDRISEKIAKTFKGLKVAVHYGCHILRPRQVVQFDNPGTPSIFDRLAEATGAESVPWETKLECCGSPVWGVDDQLSMDLTEKKIRDARSSGADCLCVACPFCQLQFDRVQKMLISRRDGLDPLPSILFTQLLGLSLGIDGEDLGIHLNELKMNGLMDFLT